MSYPIPSVSLSCIAAADGVGAEASGRAGVFIFRHHVVPQRTNPAGLYLDGIIGEHVAVGPLSRYRLRHIRAKVVANNMAGIPRPTGRATNVWPANASTTAATMEPAPSRNAAPNPR